MDYNFRLAKHDDCERIANIKKEVWNTTYRGIYKDEILDNFDVSKQTEKFKRMVDSETQLYVIETQDRIIGYFAYGKPFKQYGEYKIEFELLYILKEYQGKGIGTTVFDFVKKKIAEMDIDRFYLCCNKYNYNAQKLYEKMGGKIVHIDEDGSEKDRVQVIYEYELPIIKKTK